MIVIKLIRKKPGTSAPTKDKVYQNKPEVYDWQGNRIDENARVKQTEREYIEKNREVQAARDAAEAAERAQAKQQEKMLDELIRLGFRLSRSTADAPTALGNIIHRQIDAALNGGEINPEKLLKIQEAFRGIMNGRIIGMDDLPPVPTNCQLLARTGEALFEEVCRNETASAVAVRTLAGILTGSASEALFQTGKGIYRMKDYVDAGGDSIAEGACIAMWGAAKDYFIGRAAEKGMKVGTKAIMRPSVIKAKGKAIEKAYNLRNKLFTSNSESGRAMEKSINETIGKLSKLTEKQRAQLERVSRKVAEDQIKRLVKVLIKTVVNTVL